MKFVTKIDWFGLTLILGPAIGISIFMLLSIIDTAPSSSMITQNVMLVITVLIWLFAFLSFVFTYYILDDNSLTARMAYFRFKKINLGDIKVMTQQEFGSRILGLSKDVLSIKLNNDEILNISPKDIDGLIKLIEKRIIELKSIDISTK